MATGDEHVDQHRPFALIGLAVTGVLALIGHKQQYQRLGQPPLFSQHPSLARCR